MKSNKKCITVETLAIRCNKPVQGPSMYIRCSLLKWFVKAKECQVNLICVYIARYSLETLEAVIFCNPNKAFSSQYQKGLWKQWFVMNFGFQSMQYTFIIAFCSDYSKAIILHNCFWTGYFRLKERNNEGNVSYTRIWSE